MMFLPALSLTLLLATSIPNGSHALYPVTLGMVRTPTYDDFIEVKDLVYFYIGVSDCRDSSDLFWNGSDCDHFPMLRNPSGLGSRLVRHAFHDATGESDGFVDLTNPENNGLQASQFYIDYMYDHTASIFSDGTPIKDVITKADFCAWAYISAVLWSRDQVPGGNNYVPTFPIKYGRITHDDADPDFPPEQFPNEKNGDNPDGGAAKATGVQINDYFAIKFAFNERETATILGAHTFGGGRLDTSGFAGMWTEAKNKFTNEFYENLVEPRTRGLTNAGGFECNEKFPSEESQEWKNSCCDQGEGDRCLGWELVRMGKGPDGTRGYQWRHSCHDTGGCTMIMLHVDMGMYRNIDAYINQSDGSITTFPPGSSCVAGGRVLATCFPIRTDALDEMPATIEEFADDMNEDTFLDEFADVFSRMIDHVAPSISLTELHSAAPTAAPTLVPDDWDCPCPYDDSYGTTKVSCAECDSGICQRTLRPGKGIDTWECEGCKGPGKNCNKDKVCCSDVCGSDGKCT